MIEIARPPRTSELSQEDLAVRQAQRERGEKLFNKMESMYHRGNRPRAISARSGEEEGLRDRVWVSLNDDTVGKDNDFKDYMYFTADVVDAGGESITGKMEVVGVSREGKLVPPVLRWLSYEQQGEILDAMEARFDMIKDFAAQNALQA